MSRRDEVSEEGEEEEDEQNKLKNEWNTEIRKTTSVITKPRF